VAIAPAAVGVRDTKNRAGGTLIFGPHAWQRFLGALKSGELDA
jgi:hypothetical protein